MNEKIYNDTALLINELFLELKARCPAWPQSWPNPEIEKRARQIWLESLVNNKIQNWQYVKNGLSKIKSSFVPTVDEFISLCKPSIDDLNIPTVDQAYKEACKNSYDTKYPTYKDGKPVEPTWSHEIVRYSARDTGTHDIVSHENFEKFKRHYEFYLKKILNGEQLEAILKPLPNKNDVPATLTPEVGKNALNGLKSHLNVISKPDLQPVIEKVLEKEKEIAFRKHILSNLIKAGIEHHEAYLELKAFVQTQDYQKALKEFKYTSQGTEKLRIDPCKIKTAISKS